MVGRSVARSSVAYSEGKEGEHSAAKPQPNIELTERPRTELTKDTKEELPRSDPGKLKRDGQS